jgi:AcrR family transcriptional regulator
MTVRELRSDARQNQSAIRDAACAVFATAGLDAPMEQIAQAAGVSKGTIYHRFGSREALIESVVGELVEAKLAELIEHSLAEPDPWSRLHAFALGTWLLQFESTVVNDVFCRAHADSGMVWTMCTRAAETGARLLAECHAENLVRPEITGDDLYIAMQTFGAALRHGPRQTRADFQRRGEYLLAGIRTP